MDKHGESALYDRRNDLSDQCGRLANAIFDTPARTVGATLEKLRIAYIATGDGPDTCTGDGDLEAHQDLDTPWMKSVIADLEHLTGGGS